MVTKRCKNRAVYSNPFAGVRLSICMVLRRHGFVKSKFFLSRGYLVVEQIEGVLSNAAGKAVCKCSSMSKLEATYFNLPSAQLRLFTPSSTAAAPQSSP